MPAAAGARIKYLAAFGAEDDAPASNFLYIPSIFGKRPTLFADAARMHKVGRTAFTN
jgi:hypothetical protein